MMVFTNRTRLGKGTEDRGHRVDKGTQEKEHSRVLHCLVSMPASTCNTHFVTQAA